MQIVIMRYEIEQTVLAVLYNIMHPSLKSQHSHEATVYASAVTNMLLYGLRGWMRGYWAIVVESVEPLLFRLPLLPFPLNIYRGQCRFTTHPAT